MRNLEEAPWKREEGRKFYALPSISLFQQVPPNLFGNALTGCVEMFRNILPQFSVNGYFVLYCHCRGQTLAKYRSVSGLCSPSNSANKIITLNLSSSWSGHGMCTHTTHKKHMHTYTNMSASDYLGSFDNQLEEALINSSTSCVERSNLDSFTSEGFNLTKSHGW